MTRKCPFLKRGNKTCRTCLRGKAVQRPSPPCLPSPFLGWANPRQKFGKAAPWYCRANNKPPQSEPQPFLIADVTRAVGLYFGVDESVITSPVLQRCVVRVRQLVWYLCRNYTPCSLNQMGRHTGAWTSQTVCQGIKFMESLVDTEAEWLMAERAIGGALLDFWAKQPPLKTRDQARSEAGLGPREKVERRGGARVMPPSSYANRWPEERVAMLRRIVADGGSLQDIADALHISRNAAGGKCRRLGIRLINRPAQRTPYFHANLLLPSPTHGDV